MFDYSTQVKVATISLWNLFAVVVNVMAFVILYMKANRNQTLKAFFVVQIAMLIWLVGKVFKTVSPNEDIRWAFIVFYYAGICLLEISFFSFSYIYYKGKSLPVWAKSSLGLLGLMQFLVVVTNPYHYLFYSRYGFWGDDFGKLFYVHVVINYALILAGMILCSIKFNKQVKFKGRLQKYIVAIAILLPIILNFIYITRTLEALFDWLGIQVFDITPLVYTWSLLIFVYATFKYEFFDVSPMLKHEITHRLDTPIIVLDSAGEVLYTNQKLKKEVVGKGVKDKNREIKKLITLKGHVRKQADASIVLHYNNKFYQRNVTKINSLGGIQYLVTLNDISEYQLTKNKLDSQIQELNNANQKLQKQINMLTETSKIGARNYVAREMHDIIGHSLVVTMKLLEICKLTYKKNTQKAVESLEKAVDCVKNGFNEMKQVNAKSDKQYYTTTHLKRDIESMLKVVSISNIIAKCYVRGEERVLDEKRYDILKKVTTELVTNTLKHAKASELFIAITFKEDGINLSYMDNGVGCTNLVRGNGLMGIESRLALVGGTFRYQTAEGEGFIGSVAIDAKGIDL